MTTYLYKHRLTGAAEMLEYPALDDPDIELMAAYDEGEPRPNIMGMRFEGNALIPEEPTYMRRRRVSYPSLGDQLDALWKEFGPGLKSLEAKAIAAAIAKVKQDNPVRADTPVIVKDKPPGKKGQRTASPQAPAFAQMPDLGGPFQNEQEANGWATPDGSRRLLPHLPDNRGSDDQKDTPHEQAEDR